jgi:hypothetical protein
MIALRSTSAFFAFLEPGCVHVLALLPYPKFSAPNSPVPVSQADLDAKSNAWVVIWLGRDDAPPAPAANHANAAPRASEAAIMKPMTTLAARARSATLPLSH